MDDKNPNASGEMAEQQPDQRSLTSTSKSTSSLSNSSKKLQHSQNSSAANSPKASRNSSPIRRAASIRSGGRSRKNSREFSPSRSASATNNNNPPSAAAIQRTLSATITPQLQHSHSDLQIRAPVPQKAPTTAELKETPRWPISPRLKSPPPVNTSLTSPRKTEHEFPIIKLQRSGSASGAASSESRKGDAEEESPSTSTMRGQPRGASTSNFTLETVQETSQPGTPAAISTYDGSQAATEDEKLPKIREQENPIDSAFSASLKSTPASAVAESGNESAGKSEVKMRSTTVPVTQAARPNIAPAVKSFASVLPAGRGKVVGEGSTRNMTVETETVNSIPHVAIGGGAGTNNGSLRTKPSSETIRPKKEKKRTTRKAPSASGVASSKADIFEAKIASAVDEADSSDSDETFVYESNPPDAADRPRNRFHSRTPSATSMVSQLNTRDGNRHGLEGGHSVALKKSMKFANSYNNNGNNEGTGVDDDGKGTARSNMGTGRGTVYHHHIGRWGRRDGNGHPSLFDQESPFPNAARPTKFSGNNSRHSSRPASPRFSHNFKGNGKRSPMTATYDPDDVAADDERTPLISSSIRSARSRGQRLRAGMRHHDRQSSEDGHSMFGRNSACWIFSVMFVLIAFVATGFVFATTEPLEDVHIVALQNIVASEQELMLDLVVSARNPNAIGVAVDSLDMKVFVITKHASEESSYARRTSFYGRRDKNSLTIREDSPYDPPPQFGDDPATETIPLGSILVFDSPLSFDAFPWQHERSQSTGAVTLTNPGATSNRTLEWERALKYDFDLEVKGVLKYTLPLSSKIRKAPVEGRVTVKPQKAGKDKDKDEGNGTDDDGGPEPEAPTIDYNRDSGIPFTSDRELQHEVEKKEEREKATNTAPIQGTRASDKSIGWLPHGHMYG